MLLPKSPRIPVWYLAVPLLVHSVGGSPAVGQELLYRFDGRPTNLLGARISGIGDLDGDGIRDFLYSAPGAREAKGLVRGHSGADGSRLFTIVGPPYKDEGAADGFGFTLAEVGDVDGDGVQDFVIGAPRDNLSLYELDNGSALVYSGAFRTLLHRLTGPEHAELGSAAAGLGDLNGDGFDDFAIGASGWENAARELTGAVFVYSGLDATLLYRVEGLGHSALFGTAVTSLSDLDRDGHRELVVGAPGYSQNPGWVHVFSGVSGVPLWVVSSFADELGSAVASVPDRNGDGIEEILVGAPQRFVDKPGFAKLLSGASGGKLARFRGAAADDLFGVAVASAGDVNGDGHEDYVIGASQRNVDSARIGYARLYSGRTRFELYQFEGEGEDELGGAVAGLGDLDGDGLAEMAVGAINADSNSGHVKVYRGNDLYLNFSPNQAAAGDAVLVTAAEGGALQPVLHVLVSVDGAPTFEPLFLDAFDAMGIASRSEVVPPGLSGRSFGVQAFGLDAVGRLVDSADEVLAVR